MTVIVTGWHQFYGESKYRLKNIWPRGVKVDVAGFDIYNQLGVVKDGEENTEGTNLRGRLLQEDRSVGQAARRRVGARRDRHHPQGGAAAPALDPETHRRLERAGGVAMAYFNTTLNSIAPWQLSTRPKRVGYREAQPGTPLLPRR